MYGFVGILLRMSGRVGGGAGMARGSSIAFFEWAVVFFSGAKPKFPLANKIGLTLLNKLSEKVVSEATGGDLGEDNDAILVAPFSFSRCPFDAVAWLCALSIWEGGK